MENSQIGPLLEVIGNVLAQDTDYVLDGTFLYAECEAQMVDISIFKDLGGTLLFRWPMDDLTYALLNLWEAEIPEKRWSAIQYTIIGDKFSAIFTFPDQFDELATTMQRREHILQQRFGNKRIEYPPIPNN